MPPAAVLLAFTYEYSTIYETARGFFATLMVKMAL
jgi:hypothetical protein